MFETGKGHYHNATSRLGSRDPPAAAYWEYLVAYFIVVEAIPAHRDFHDKINTSRSQLHREYFQLVKACAH